MFVREIKRSITFELKCLFSLEQQRSQEYHSVSSFIL